MKILEVIESRRWRNKQTGLTASIYGACPWHSANDKNQWAVETVGYTWRLDCGAVGLGRAPVKTMQEAIEVMDTFNSR